MAKRKIKLGNQEVMAEEIGFQPDAENGGEKWSVYALEDGTTLKVKPVVTDVLKIEGAWDQNGNPVYSIKSSLVVSANPPDALKRKV